MSTTQETTASTGTASTGTVRTLTESLRQRGAESLAELLRQRPDLADPPPLDLPELASRATGTGSVARAIDRLNAWQRHILLALATAADPVSVHELATVLDRGVEPVADVVEQLRDLALLWGSDDALHLVRAAREQFGSYPAGLAPRSPAPLSDADLDRLLGEIDPEAYAVLERLVWSPAGAVPGADRVVSLASARSPVEQLLARRLLRAVDKDHVLLPREVSWRLRGARLTPEPVEPAPSALNARDGRRRLVDNGAAGAAGELLGDLELVVRSAEDGQLRLLRTGGVGQRDLAALAQRLGADVAYASFVLEAASGAHLIATDGAALAVTTAYDDWQRRDGLARWRHVADAWRDATRRWTPETAKHSLGPEAELPRLAELRPLLVSLLLEVGIGRIAERGELVAALAWQRPGLRRVGPLPLDDAVRMLSRELEWLGGTALGAASSLAPLVRDRDAAPPPEIERMFPTPVEHLVIQSDLTAVAAGPLTHDVAGALRLLADQESRGTGGVYRFSATALRRAFDAGWSADQVRRWLADHSATGVPQPLAYLVDDVARRHGDIRVGAASSYLNVADASQVAALLARPDAAALGLRRVSDTLLVAAADPEELIEWLRHAGYSPTAEGADGRTLHSPRPHRIRSARAARRRETTPPQVLAAALLQEPAARSGTRGQSTAEALLLLGRATRAAQPVRVAWVGTDGSAVERALSPLDLDGGALRAVDTEGAQVVTIPLSRISNIRLVDDSALD